jgi:hypothetical protein
VIAWQNPGQGVTHRSDVEFSAPPPAARYDLSMAAITRNYRIRAYPNGAQRRLLDRWFG